MATVTNTWTDTTLNSTITVQVTYTITQYNDYAKLVITKHEIKSTKPVTYAAFSGNIYYYDSSGNYTSTSIPLSALTTSTSYKTRWSGTKTINAYKSTTDRKVQCCEVEIPIGTVTAYTLTYSASGASGVPSPTTKYYGYAVKLSSVTPTKTGYTFAGWKSSYDNVVYSSSATYPKGNNANATLTAQWTANVYTVSYKANGGSGTVANTSKTYDVSANFSNGAGFSRKITSSSGVTNEYVLSSWNTKADGSGTTYQLGSAIPNITANLTVYAIWTLTYIYPHFSNYKGYRTATDDPDDTTYTDSGEYPYITFDFTGFSNDGGSTYSAPSCTILVNNEDTYTPTLTLTTSTGGSLAYKITSPYSADAPHTVVITLSDPNTPQHAYSANFTIMSATYPIDLWANRNDDEVYMGVMHPYVPNQKLTLTDTVIDGGLSVHDNVVVGGGTQTEERRVDVQNYAGRIYMYSSVSPTGYRGIYGYNANGNSHYFCYADQSNNVYFKGLADKATADSSGNTISSTYVKKAGDTMTGSLNMNNGVYLRLNNDAGSSYSWNQIWSSTASSTSNLNLQADGYICFYVGNTTTAPTGRMYLYYDHLQISGYIGTGSYVRADGGFYCNNNSWYHIKNSAGTDRLVCGINSSNEYFYGYGSYTNNEGTVYYDGNGVYIRSKAAVAVNATSLRPYSGNSVPCGTTTYYWTRFYANTAEWVKSDRKAKDVLGDLDFSEDLIMNLKPVQFMLKDSDHRRIHMGFIAQDAGDVAKKINKNLSFIIADYVDPEKGEYLGEEVNDEELTWGLSYTELIAPTIKVVQDQQRKIDKLERRIEQLEKGVQI